MAVQKIREMLKESDEDGEVNAMRVYKGYDASTVRATLIEYGFSDAVIDTLVPAASSVPIVLTVPTREVVPETFLIENCRRNVATGPVDFRPMMMARP